MTGLTQSAEQTAWELARWAATAPSPDNNQPWRIRVGTKTLEFFLNQEHALPSDVHGMFDLMAVGAAMENACLAADQLGLAWQLEVDISEKLGRPDPTERVGRLTWREGKRGCEASDAPRRSGLGVWIEQRQTSRGWYRPRPLDTACLARLAEAIQPIPEVQVHWATARVAIAEMAGLVQASDGLRLEQPRFHEELFRQLRWTAEEAERTGDGLDVRLLGLPPGGRVVLRAIRHWWLLSFLNRLGASRLLAIPAALSVFFSGAIGLLSVPRANAQQFVEAGRALQRLWLAATGEGFCVHPLGSLPIFLAHLQQLGGAYLSRRQVTRCQRIQAKLCALVPDLRGRTLVIALRIGEGRPSRLRSRRRPVGEVTELVGEEETGAWESGLVRAGAGEG